ncbi:unnamed protein product [Paramecium pentaurelia]|uniref:Uncharacterized protein n=1 Tax=Paramecium pentaurelia TaxID=43138 RepID=A0A8S1SWS5_9CILI|nr:unnamed protein product [Paramecium pentaurelia]
MNNQKESENDDSDKSQVSITVQQKNKERQLRKIQKLQSLINKPFQQLTDEELNKRRILSKVSDLIGKTNNPHQFLQPLNHKFVLNINHLQNASIPKITSNQTDPEKDYVDYLMMKKQKQQEQMRRQAIKKQNLKENYDQLWQQEEDLSDKEIKDTYNVNKALTIVHKSQVQKEKQLKSDERIYFGKNSQSVQRNSNFQSLTNSRLILMQDQDINETECREQQARRTLKKMKTKQVINIVQQATKKIFNKKDEQIQKELIMHQVYKQMNKEKKKESIKSIDSIFRNSQNEEIFQQSQNQKMITNKIMSENKFFQPKKLSEIKPIQSRVQLSHIILKQDSRTDDSPPRFHSRKISLINDKITNLVSQIDLIQQKEIDQLTFIKQLENEQDLYKTYRESLQPDQIQDTLKSLLGPSNNNYRKPFRFNNKKFFNQIL